MNYAKAGTLLAGGFKAILFAIEGDLDYLPATLGLPRWSRKDSPCCLCKCSGEGWQDFRPVAE